MKNTFKKIVSILFVLCITGCSNSQLKQTEISHYQYSNSFDFIPIGFSNSGIYYITDDILYFKADNESSISLGSVNYINGNKANLVSKTDEIIQEDYFSGKDIICYGDRLYLEYLTEKFDGGKYYSLCSVNQKGEDFQTHIIFDFLPQRVVMTNGKIYVQYLDENNNQFINIYDSKFELIDTEEYDNTKAAIGFYIIDGEINVPDTFQLYQSDDIDVSYKIENLYSDENRKVVSSITLQNKTLTFENKLILFVNDEYFYTSSCTDPQVYERYNLNGELDSSITIKDHIKSKGEFKHLLTSDFSYIIKLKNPDIAYGHSDCHIFEVDFSKGECHYVED